MKVWCWINAESSNIPLYYASGGMENEHNGWDCVPAHTESHGRPDRGDRLCNIRFREFTDVEWAELEAWRIEFLLALEYSRNPPRFPEDE